MLTVHLKKLKSADYVDIAPDHLAHFLKGRDPRAWEFVRGPASSRKQFQSAQTQRSSTPAKPMSPARAPVARHPLPTNLRDAIARGYSNAQVAAMAKAGAFTVPNGAGRAAAEGLSGHWLFEAKRRGLVHW